LRGRRSVSLSCLLNNLIKANLNDVWTFFRLAKPDHLIFRFLKRNLLFDKSQTPCIQHQLNWWWLCLFAYWLVYHVRWVAGKDNRPWMPDRRTKDSAATPSQVQRGFVSIIREFGLDPSDPKTRGKSPGAINGQTRDPKTTHQPLKKSSNQPKTAA